ncbi:hypothetical protein [Gallaecimonas pentaromativorans]|uniref:hypothetical protein n=1 Tax=Gallaecimonas pentaromativorans TaxID=584787 RepID=UPI00067F2478|nr:hypothetical protein [Gallaecimonas pentaromativorans]MED5524521.1 hypothetical protein [Pseudomonadota bacterium]
MNNKKWLPLLLCLLATGCAQQSTPKASPQNRPLGLTPYQTIWRAAEVAPKGFPGRFELTVKAVGMVHGYLYLNSELDYRDQRSISIEIPPKVAKQLLDNGKLSPEPLFIGKTLLVDGFASRVRININPDKPGAKKLYYYQTHVLVKDRRQIQVLASQ